MIIWPAKDPGEVLDYTWRVPLDAGDTVASYGVSIASGTGTIDSDSSTDSTVTAIISGGDANTSIFISLTATTTAGRTFKDTGVIPVIDRADAVLADFRMRYPAFAAVPDGQIAYWIALGGAEVSGWCEADRAEASLLYASHHLSAQGMGDGAVPAGVTSFKSGTFSATVSDKLAGRTGFSRTSYGAEFLSMKRRNFAGPRLAWTPPAEV